MADTNDDSASPELTAEEEAALQRESQAIKAEANALFAAGDYHNALARYDDALASCPPRLGFDRAGGTLQGGTDGRDAGGRDTDGRGTDGRNTDGRNTNERITDESITDESITDERNTESSQENTDVEPTNSKPSRDSADNKATKPPPNPDEARIRTKALLRRAHARSQAGGWQNLSSAESDYRLLLATPNLPASDAPTVRRQLADLPRRTEAAREAEMADMWGKLRSLGDGILKPFGLSTGNFRMVKDEATGGYSVDFDQGRGSS
ncbi:tetratricopeptide repeat protein 1 (TTC1) [Ophiocordyceps camponoti-floridani]|uniref:Tetratricopeptide repeat protein 1 (TTC1) n=1 Tax=Ophiocordyceps camponoti-floridani TaxID=2030778 RepID=A0A8H4Q3G5_9HYPO|nr:tetratricopeptide repeat protein 1 (TTC1) [Ophiocordyceps camponoti-floridani]